jgi:polyhydroxyalkanoate synthesis regulator phasin
MRQDRIMQQLDKMVSSGRMTEDEARRIRATHGTPEFEKAVLDVRLRHASEQLDAAVDDGEMSRAEADGQLERLREGEHPKGLRSRLRSHRKASHGTG